MPPQIDSPKAREKLSPRREPYWVKIAGMGKFLGFRKTASGGFWIAKLRTTDGNRTAKSLGGEDSFDYTAALKATLEWFDNINEAEPSNTRIKDATSAYLDYLHNERALSTYKSDRSHVMNHILPVLGLGEKRIAQVKTADYEKWLRKVARNLGSENEDPERKRKAKYSANQCLKILKAALNRGHSTNRSLPVDEWHYVKPLEGGASVGRKIFLTGNEPQRLVNCCEGAFRDLVLFGLMTGCRLGEAYAMKVRDFDPDNGHWDVAVSKTGPRICVLIQDAIDLLTRLTAGKRKTDLVFLREDGLPWTKDRVRIPIHAAVERAELDPETTYYSLRHSYISSQLRVGIPSQAIGENVGTSVAMIERHYGKFLPSEKRAMLERGRIQLEVPEAKVVNIR